MMASPPDTPDAELAAPAGYHVGFWRRPWVQAVVPWATSLSVHIGIITVALVLLASGVFHKIIPALAQRQVNVPTATLAETDIGGMPNVGNMDDVTSQNAQLDPVEQSRNPLPEGEGDNIESLMNTGSPAAANSITGITGMGSLAEALGGGGGGEGSTMFGEPGGGSRFMGFDFGTAGDGSAVTRVVFVCDGSGSMEGLPRKLLVDELKETIGTLKPIQFFNVIFFQWDDFHAAFPELRSGNPRYKRDSFGYLDRLVVRGGTNPVPALEAAFRMKPQLIFLLSDGRFEQTGNDPVLKVIADHNPPGDQQVMINTILFINRDAEAEQVLKRIADENGGKYKFIGENDLQVRP